MMNQDFSKLLTGIRYAFFPRRCPYCEKVIAPSESTCEKCAQELREIPLPICYYCGRSRVHCRCRRRHSRYVSAFAAPFYYIGRAEHAIRRMKFHNEPEVARELGMRMAMFSKKVYPDVHFDLVTFVPMTKEEFDERGYNQSELLALSLSEHLQLPCVETLSKLYETRRQRTLKQRRRSGNVLGVFDVPHGEAVRDKRILLCDDLSTTGSTLTECAKMLRIYGAKEVLCITAATAMPVSEKG